MKKIILVFAGVLIAAQSFSQWSLTGNANTTTSNFIGTTDANDFRIRTNNSTRLTINSAGYAGVGATPESTSRLYSYYNVGNTYAQGSVYSASRGRISGTSTRANGYLGAAYFAPLTLDGFPISLNYMGVLGVKEDATGFGAGVVGWNKNAASGGTNYGIYGLANGAIAFGQTTDKNIGVYGRASGNIHNIGIYGSAPGSLDYAGYFTGRGYFSDKVGIGTESPSAMLTLDAPTSTSLMSLRSNGVTKMFVNASGYLGMGTTTQTSVIEVDAPAATSPFKLSIAGTTRLLMSTTGRIGIGTTVPTARLHVKTTTDGSCGYFSNYQSTSASILGVEVQTQNFAGPTFGLSASSIGSGENYAVVGKSIGAGTQNIGVWGEGSIGNTGAAYGVYGKVSGGSTTTPVYAVYGTSSGSANHWAGYFNGTTYAGSLRVGTTGSASGYIASIGGKLICEEVKVALEGNWPDYVFAKDYTLMPLEELKTNIDQNKHLPGLPSAQTIENDGGYHLGEMQKKLLEKVEELTLYVIKLNDENKELRNMMNQLKK
ncbi:MAG: hypothetical protein IPP29_19845 [Bacteroidetes bacterium]|nr:hypothetical protein [Bacteroidota bacterium]